MCYSATDSVGSLRERLFIYESMVFEQMLVIQSRLYALCKAAKVTVAAIICPPEVSLSQNTESPTILKGAISHSCAYPQLMQVLVVLPSGLHAWETRGYYISEK